MVKVKKKKGGGTDGDSGGGGGGGGRGGGGGGGGGGGDAIGVDDIFFWYSISVKLDDLDKFWDDSEEKVKFAVDIEGMSGGGNCGSGGGGGSDFDKKERFWVLTLDIWSLLSNLQLEPEKLENRSSLNNKSSAIPGRWGSATGNWSKSLRSILKIWIVP